MAAPAPLGFERSSVPGAGLDELDMEALGAYIQRRAPAAAAAAGIERMALRLGLLAQVSGGVAPTIAGLMAFGTCPQLIRPEWGLSTIRVEGSSLADPIAARADLEGNLAALLEQGLAFVAGHTRSTPDLLRPDELHPEYPEAAVREALTNALIHRDLRLPGRVGLRIFDDRLEISSPGGLPAPLPLDELAHQGGLSLPRNPLLASVARGLGLVEQVGRGLTRIRQTIGAETSAPVQFATSHHEVRVILPSGYRAGGAGGGRFGN
ncbi:MAG: hypothetical protein H6710_04715 [Myxococcales bacterium]|nr:hypothetical protein [Myxococcales bacterium]MCB9705643.1 hypothetical protein [Myxococcales bacterium]